jgi:CelD/BcsL family acetyltransferase involved in cellulose biosynthesis
VFGDVSEATGELEGGGQVESLPAAGEWDALAELADAPPFLRPGWVAAWMRAFGRGELQVVEVRRDADLVGVLPMQRHGKAMRAPTNWHTPMFGPLGIDARAREELLGSLFEGPVTVELNHLGGCATAGDAVAEAARGDGRLVVARAVSRSPFIQLEGDFADYEQTLSRNRRKALRRHRRKLEDEGALQLEVHDGRTDLDQLLAELYAVEASGWKGENGTAISSREDTQRFYTDVARWAAARGWLRLAFHRLDGRPIACDFALEHGGVWYTLKAGYDEEFRSFGPGALLLRDEIAHCCEQGVSRIELLGHEDSFKASWTDQFSERTWVRAFGKTPAGAVRWAGIASWERVRPALRRVKRMAG